MHGGTECRVIWFKMFFAENQSCKSLNLGHHPTMIKIAPKKVSSKDRKLLQNAVAIIFPRK